MRNYLIESADSYHKNKFLVNNISTDSNLLKLTNNIFTLVNDTIIKLTTNDDINICSKSIIDLLEKYKNCNDENLFMYCLDILIKMIHKKSVSYIEENKKIYYIYCLFIHNISKKYNIVNDYFIQFTCYICPYVIPKLYNIKEFNNDKLEFKKRYGFINDQQSINEFLNNIKGNSYCFFSYIYATINEKDKHDFKLNSELYINEYLTALLDKNIINEYDYPIVSNFICFLDVFGNYLYNKNNSNLVSAYKYVIKHCESLKKNVTALKTMRSTINSNIFILNNLIKLIENKTNTPFINDTKS